MKNKGVALLLIIFLGVFGAHKFYLGNIKTGVLYLVLSITGITFILALLDFFIMLFTSTAQFEKKYN